jgi:hypothetical protein
MGAVKPEQEQQHAADQVEMRVRRASTKFCWMPIPMPASMPNSSTTTLTHIINDPIISLSFRFRLGVESRSGEPKLTRYPRLCDLMSRKGLAYLFLGIEPLKRFEDPIRATAGEGAF